MNFKMFARRFCAYVIDMTIVMLFVNFLDWILIQLAIIPAALRGLMYYAFTLVYFAMQESGDEQATIGKRIMNLVVCDMDGEPISFLRALGRNFARIINMAILSLGYVTILFTKKQQGVHDMIARTLVVDGKEYYNDEDESEYEEESA